MAAHVTAALAHGVLTVKGTAAADLIHVQVEHGVVAVSGVKKTFPTGRVKLIDVVGGKGHDTIQVETPNIPVEINGQAQTSTASPVSSTTAAPAASTNQARIISISPPPAAATTTATTTTTSTTTAPPDSATPILTVTPVPVVLTGADLAAAEQRIIDDINAQRVQAGVAPLAVSSALMQEANIQSTNMAQLNVMSHSLPGTNAPELADRAALVGYNYATLGENIAFNYPDADSVVAGWLASPPHRANILNPAFTQTGVAIAYNSAGDPYYTQEFGTPAS